ncbi:MAG: hypothetical protein KatS3mg057_1130 [Herpetosiphonaceae bacterium]|nr:MAG: hypothetical protein KatS3mg057_1130 [Herpetosiphonaceae bacterium]
MAALQCYYCNHPISSSAEHCPSCNRPLLIHGRYQLVGVLGKGGFGVVFEAIDQRLNRRCAVKVISAASLNEQQQIEAEASILSKYASQFPFIPDIYDIWSEASQTYLVMEYIAGHGLDQLLIKPWPVTRVEEFLRALLGHLAQLHAAGIVHRDLKPANIKRTPDGRYLLLDFGIAKQGAVTQTAAKALSLDYASPEQIQGRPTDARSDLYSLAATAYHLLTGQPPTRADARLIAGSPVYPPSQLVAGVTPALEGVLMRMLELQVERRPTSAEAAIQMLDAPSLATVTLPAISPQNNLEPTIPIAGLGGPGYSAAAPFPPSQSGGSQGAAASSSAGMPTIAMPVSAQPFDATQQTGLSGSSIPPQPIRPEHDVTFVGGIPQRNVARRHVVPAAQRGMGSRLVVEALVVGLLVIGAVVAYLAYSSQSAGRQSRPVTGNVPPEIEQRIQTQTALEEQQQATQEALEAPTIQAQATATAQAVATTEAELQAIRSSPLQATAVAQVEAARAQWPLRIADTFDNNRRFWPLNIESGGASRGSLGLIDGAYRWNVRGRSGVIFTASPELDPAASFFLSVETRKISGAGNSGYGVMFRQSAPNDYYVFLINDSQSFACFLNKGGRSIPLIDWTHSSAIKTDGTNRLSVLAEGSHFTFFINDLYVGEADSAELRSGYAGLAAVLFADDQASFEFDNFQLYAP